MTAEIAILIAQILLKYGPQTAAAIKSIFTNPNPTDADWDAIFVIAAKEYSSYTTQKP